MPMMRRMILQIVIVLVALTVLFVGYYWVHKPLSLGLVQTLGGALLDLLTVGAIAIVAGGLGRRALTLRFTNRSPYPTSLSETSPLRFREGVGGEVNQPPRQGRVVPRADLSPASRPERVALEGL